MSRLLAGVIVLLGVAATPAAAELLDGVAHLAIRVDVAHPIDGVAADDLRRRLAAFLADRAPAIAPADTGPDRLHLAIGIRPRSSAALRGFWLPWSGTYAIGTVRLALERTVRLPGAAPRAVTAIVWQRERIIATRWSGADTAVTGAVQELLDELGTALR